MELPKVDPVFVKAGEIPDFKTLKEYELCEAVCKRIKKDSLLGVQRIGMLWRIYLKTKEARVTVLANKVEIRDHCVNVFNNNPMRARLAEGETDQSVMKVTIKDLPLSKGNKGIEQYLITQGIKLRGKVEFAKARNENNELTDWLNGERIVFVDSFDDPLPRKTWIGDTSVRIFHRDQPSPSNKYCTNCHQDGHYRKQCTSEPCCIVCKGKNHGPGDKECSGTAKQQLKHVTAFAGKADPLSNFYPCEIKVFGMSHRSSEHAYQYSKAIQTGKDKIAERILEAKSAYQAKVEASFLPFNPNWIDEKEKVMEQVLRAKSNGCPEFCEALLNSDTVIAEAVPGDLFWSTGLTKEQCLTVKRGVWPGKNKMGKLLVTLKESIIEKNNDK